MFLDPVTPPGIGTQSIHQPEKNLVVWIDLHPSSTIRIFSSAEYFLRVFWRIFLTVFSTLSFFAISFSFRIRTAFGSKSVS
jgi:hypothetical protein